MISAVMPPPFVQWLKRCAPLGCVLMVACAAYDPPVQADHASLTYQRALKQCRAPADLKARQIAGNTPFSAIHAIFTSDEPERQEILACMQARGYPLQR